MPEGFVNRLVSSTSNLTNRPIFLHRSNFLVLTVHFWQGFVILYQRLNWFDFKLFSVFPAFPIPTKRAP
jgi:hypothetical protein